MIPRTITSPFAEDSSVADNTLHIPQGVSFLCVPACTLPSAPPLSLRLPAAQSVSINAKDGQVPFTETREGIARTDLREGDKEGPTQHLCHFITCSAQSCDIYCDEDYCLPCDPIVPPLVEPAPAHVMHHLTCDQLCILWHQRLGQLHNRRLKLAACAAIGLLDIGTEDELQCDQTPQGQ
jgi:hypothetical protein